MGTLIIPLFSVGLKLITFKDNEDLDNGNKRQVPVGRIRSPEIYPPSTRILISRIRKIKIIMN